MTIAEKDIQVQGRNVHYLESGTNNPRAVMLLHGNVGDANFHWRKLIPSLTHLYRVIAPDLPDFGKSDPLPQASLTALTDWLHEFYAVLGLKQGVVVGTSYGGLLARLFASAYPHETPALILINGGGLPPKSGGFAKLLAQLPVVNDMIFNGASNQMVKSREALNWLVQYPKTPKDDGSENHERMSAKGYTAPDPLTEEMVTAATNSSAALSRLMRTQVLSPIPEKRTPMIPALILWGEDDEISPIATGKRINKAIPGSELVPIAETKSAPHIEEPEVVAFQIERFLENLGRPSKDDLPGVGRLG